MPVVTTIPATKPRYAAQKVKQKKRRVAAYARVSTDHEEQQNSYDAQIKYYTDYIQGRQDWDFVGMFSDEGITGTSIKKRDGFNDMVKTALEGKVDLIITKSVSRFARNTVDSLSTIRKLKDHGVEVYFEKENIWTFDSKGELLITIMSSLAQEESRSISENTLWGIRRSFQNGNEYVPFKHFLGYDRGENGGLVVNEEEAKIVRFIYNRFLNGGTYNGIAAELTQMGVKTPYGNEKWIGPTVRNILTNEKYKGDALLQKKYTSDYLTKKMFINHGEVPQYYVPECHEAIIEPQIFDLIQAEVLRRNGMSGRRSNTHIFSTKIQCADCGAWFGPVVYHSNTPKRRIVWRCSDKYNKAHEKCHTPALDIEAIKDAFVRSLNEKLEHRDEVLGNLMEIRNLISGGERTLQQQTALWEESRLLEEQIQALIMQNARIAMDQEQYQKEFDELVERHSRVKQEYEEQAIAAEQDVGRVAQIDYFISTLEELNAPVTEFDEQLWISMVDHVVVHSKEDIRVVYLDGIEK